MTAELCRHFRSKTMYVAGRDKAEEADAESLAAGFCWCNCTMTQIGEDDRLVGYDRCASEERACYQGR